MNDRIIYPFPAIVGQESLKRSLLLNIVNPGIGGVLIRGEKGTAKSTAVRALTQLLPEIDVVSNCPFACAPDQPEVDCSHCSQATDVMRREYRRVRVVELPLNATEDRVAGGIDFSHAIQHGRRSLEPGLLASAHRGILYVALGDKKPVDEALMLAQAMAQDERTRHIVVDTEEDGLVTFGLARNLAAALHAQYFKIDDLKAQSLVNIVKGQDP